VHLSFWKTLPNYFVGVGLLFTFIGLVVALDSASGVIGTGANVDETQQALGDLLNAATFKFFTSIAGIFCSLMIGVFLKRFIYKVEKGFMGLSDEIEEKLLWVSPQSIAISQLKELEKQSTELQYFNQEFGMQLSDRLAQVLENTFEPLTEAMQKMSGNVDSIQMDSINSALENVNKGISEAAGNEMEAIVKAMKDVRTSLETTTTDLRAQMGDVGENFGKKIEKSAETLDPFTSQMSRFNDNIEQFSSHINDQKNAMDGVVEKINDAAVSIDMASKGMRNAGDPVVKTADKMSKAAEKLVLAMNSVESIQGSLSNMTENFANSSDTLQEVWEKYESRFGDVDESLKKIVKELIEGTSAHQKDIQDFVMSLDRSFKDAISSLSGGIGELSETMEELGQIKKRDS